MSDLLTNSNSNVFYPWPDGNTYITWPNSYTYPYSYTVRCAWCQGTHYGKCPKLKAVSYRPDGTVERIEFFEEK